MRLKEKIDLIKEEINSEIKPLDSNKLLADAHIEPVISSKPKYKFFSLRFQTVFLTILVLAIIIPFALSNIIQKTSEDMDQPDATASLDDKVYSFIATSAVALSYSTIDIFADDNSLTNSESSFLVANKLNDLNRYLAPIQLMLSMNKNNYYPQISNNDKYANKIVYEGFGLLNEELYYDIYYNEERLPFNKIEIEALIIHGDVSTKLFGVVETINNNVILKMTHYIDENNESNYFQIIKNLNDNKDSYYYMIVKEDQVISNNKLTLFENEQPYAILENLLSQTQKTKFTIYSEDNTTFNIEYQIVAPSNEYNSEHSEGMVVEESGNIKVNVQEDTSSFVVYSNNSSKTFTYSKPIK